MMRRALIILAVLLCAGCGGTRSEATPAELHAAIVARDEAITTSAQARAEAAAARNLAQSYEAEARRLDQVASTLRHAEITSRIARVSLWLLIVGGIALAVGVFLVLRLGGKTALSLAIGGAATAGLGLVGLWLAPHWIAAAWVCGVVLLVGLAGGLVYLLHGHQRALADVWDQDEADILSNPRLRALLGKAGVRLPPPPPLSGNGG